MKNYSFKGFPLTFPESTILSVYSLASGSVYERKPNHIKRFFLLAPSPQFLYSYKCRSGLVGAFLIRQVVGSAMYFRHDQSKCCIQDSKWDIPGFCSPHQFISVIPFLLR